MSKQPNSVYLVDTENTGYTYQKIQSLLTAGDQVILFYTDSNATMAMKLSDINELTRSGASIRAIHCKAGTHNALDFQIVSYMGYVLHDIAEHHKGKNMPKIFIASSDCGYDNAVWMWKSLGFGIIKRLDTKNPAAWVTVPEA